MTKAIDIMPQIEKHAIVQQTLMNANAHKSGWCNDNPLVLAAQMTKHSGRLTDAIMRGAPPAEVEIHAANLHNFVMMIAEAYALQQGVDLANGVDEYIRTGGNVRLSYVPI